MKKNKKVTFDIKKTVKIASLAKLKVNVREKNYLTKQFNETLKVVNRLKNIQTENIEETSHAIGLVNIFREDKIDRTRILSQKEALINAKRSYNGYFVVKAVFDEK